MDNKNFKILKWSVIVLAILNIALMANMWISAGHKGGRPHPPMHEGAGPKMMIIEELKLTSAQVKEFEKLVEAHRSGMRALESKSRTLHENYFKLLQTDTLDPKQKAELENSIANNQKAIDSITFNHFKLVRKLCTPEQKQHFDEIIGDILKHMRGQGSPPPQPNGPPPPQGM